MTFELKHPLTLFILKAAGLYFIWFVAYELYLHPEGTIDHFMIESLITQGSWVLDFLGFKGIQDHTLEGSMRTLGIDGTFGVWIGDPCDGIELFALFIGFLLAFPTNYKNLWWFLPLGVLAIHFLNLLRVVGLSILQYYKPELLEFNHTYTFTILVYGFVMFLWYIWASRFSGGKEILKNAAHA